MPSIEFHHSASRDVAALYVDGELVASGPVANVTRAALVTAGVEITTEDNNPAFLLGGDQPAATLDEVEAYRAAVAARKMQVEALRREAELKAAEANRLAQSPIRLTPDDIAKARNIRAQRQHG